jgi:hypothetical protein
VGVSCRPPCRFEQMVMYPIISDKEGKGAGVQTANKYERVPAISSSSSSSGDVISSSSSEPQKREGGIDLVLDVGHNPPALEQMLVKVVIAIRLPPPPPFFICSIPGLFHVDLFLFSISQLFHMYTYIYTNFCVEKKCTCMVNC